jgi:hypothetical protein
VIPLPPEPLRFAVAQGIRKSFAAMDAREARRQPGG